MNLDFVFQSPDHLRYENGNLVSGPHGGAGRIVKVEPNINGCEGYNVKKGDGYIVTIFYLSDNQPEWKKNIQMTPKPMRIVNQTPNEIELRGFWVQAESPFGFLDFNGEDYGLTVKMKNGNIENCILHMHDRMVDIFYLKEENLHDSSKPKIEILADKANALFLQEKNNEARQILIDVYHSLKSNPNQLNEVKDYYSMGTVFLMMIDQKISDDIDTLQMMASVSYLFISKAIKKDPSNLNFYKARLMLLRFAHNPLKYTVMLGLNLIKGGFMSYSMGTSDFDARDAIYKMEIADIETNPLLYQQIPLFKDRRDEFIELIEREFFSPDITVSDIIQSGIENHNELLEFLENKILLEEDLDF